MNVVELRRYLAFTLGSIAINHVLGLQVLSPPPSRLLVLLKPTLLSFSFSVYSSSPPGESLPPQPLTSPSLFSSPLALKSFGQIVMALSSAFSTLLLSLVITSGMRELSTSLKVCRPSPSIRLSSCRRRRRSSRNNSCRRRRRASKGGHRAGH